MARATRRTIAGCKNSAPHIGSEHDERPRETSRGLTSRRTQARLARTASRISLRSSTCGSGASSAGASFLKRAWAAS